MGKTRLGGSFQDQSKERKGDMKQRIWAAAVLLLSLAGCRQQEEFGGVSEFRRQSPAASAAQEGLIDFDWEDWSVLGDLAFQNSGSSVLVQQRIWEETVRRAERDSLDGRALPGRESERTEIEDLTEDAKRKADERRAEFGREMTMEP